MARGIMADKRDKVASPTSEHSDSKSQNPVDAFNHRTGTSASCSCTKISTMQLFYEMKQRFPTVPDNVVCEFVGQNCHNRSACIDGLEDYPNSANVYPQALRNQPNKKKSNCSNRSQIANDLDKSIGISDALKENINACQNASSNENGVQMKPPIPPNTLNLINLNCCSRPVSRPTRQAPPPPILTNKSSSIQAKSLPNQPLNLSVNVIVSPVSRPSKSQQPVSHYSFTLHQPNSKAGIANTQSNHSHPEQTHANSTTSATTTKTTTTITTPSNDDTVDVPSLKYTSSAYDAEIGYQSRLEITVAGTSSNASNDNTTVSDSMHDGSNISLTRSCDVTAEPNLPSVIASSEFLEETETVHHQILCKQKLVLELEKDRKRLERMQRELLAIQAPMPDGGLDALNHEIEKLRTDCRNMAQLVEEAGPSYALGETNEAFYRNIYTGQQLPVQQRQPLRPHRPAPVPDFNQLQNRPKNHTNVAGVDVRFISTSSIQQPSLNPPFSAANEDAGWTCDLCTFQNKYTQRTCEACTMPFLSAGNQMGYNNGIFVPPSQPPYPLTHYMPMPMPMHSLPYSPHNNNNMSYVYCQPHSLPPQYYPTTQPLAPISQSMYSRF